MELERFQINKAGERFRCHTLVIPRFPLPRLGCSCIVSWVGLIRHELELSHWCVAKANSYGFSNSHWYRNKRLERPQMIQLVSSRPYLLPSILSRSLSHTGFMLSCPQPKGNRGMSKYIARKKVVAALEHLHVETDIQEVNQRERSMLLNLIDMAKAEPNTWSIVHVFGYA